MPAPLRHPRAAGALLAAGLAAALATALAAGLAACGGGGADADALCCTTAAGCAELGLAEPFPCTDAARPYCDETGAFGPPGACIPDPPGECAVDDDCDDPARPFCDGDACVGCRTASDCTVDAPVCDPDAQACAPCTSDDDCADPTGRCDLDAGRCAQCLDAADCTDPAAALCGDDGACRGCVVDAECFPGVCEETTTSCRGCTDDAECSSEVCQLDAGECVADDRVLYVDVAGGGTACTQAMPCASLATALTLVDATHDVIKVRPGSYVTTATVAVGNRTVLISAEGADLSPSMAAPFDGILLTVTGAAAAVELEGLRLHGARGATVGEGLACAGTGASRAALTLRGVQLDGNARRGLLATQCTLVADGLTITDNAGGGIVSTDSALTLTDATITANTGPAIEAGTTTLAVAQATLRGNTSGLLATGGTVTLDRVTVDQNPSGGLQLSAVASYVVRNAVVTRNGIASISVPSFGGIEISGATAGTRRIEFSTIANNIDINNVTAGITCTSLTQPVTLTNNIVYGNGGGSPVPAQITGANCAPTYSLVGPSASPVPGTGNVAGDPRFVAAADGDVHLQATSPAIDAADPAATLDVDRDGDARPQGGGRDLGADEVAP